MSILTGLCSSRSQLRALSQTLLALLMLLLHTVVWAGSQPNNYLPQGQSSTAIVAEYFADTTNDHSIETIRGESSAISWFVQSSQSLNFGYKNYPYWFRFELSNPRQSSVEQVLQLGYPLIDEIELYRYDEQGELIEYLHFGDQLPYVHREIDHPFFLHNVNLAPGAKHQVYLRVMTSGSMMMPMHLWYGPDLFTQLADDDELHAIYFGIVCTIVALNLLVFVAFREKTHLYHALSSLAFLLLLVALRGNLYPYVFSNHPALHQWLFLTLAPLFMIFAALFAREFLRIRHYSASLNSLVNLIVFVQLISLAVVLIFEPQAALQFILFSSAPCAAVLFALGPLMSNLGHRIAWVFTLASGILFLSIVLTMMAWNGLIESVWLSKFGMQIGSALEILILSGSLVYRFNRDNQLRIAAQAQSVQEREGREQAELKLLDSSLLHRVTQLPNRSCFERTLRYEIAHDDRPLVIVRIELKRMNEVIKTLGQQNADALLREIAERGNHMFKRISAIIPIQGPSVSAQMCAYDDGAFGLLLDQHDIDTHRSEIRRAVERLTKPVSYQDMVFELQPAIGVAKYPENSRDVETLLRQAEVAVDFADPNVKITSYYCPELDQYNERRLTMTTELKQAIANHSLSLFLQPKLCLRSNKVIGAEALVRWQHPKYGMVGPDEFITAAEQTGIISQLTRWVFDAALRIHNSLREQSIELELSINLSAANLHEPKLLNYLAEKLREHEVAPEFIYLELTETATFADPEQAIATLKRIRSAGLKVSIDDFGTGYSSLSYLQDLPANEIKLDRSLVQGMTRDVRSKAVLKHTIEMCHELGFKVVGEGVESAQECAALAQIGCDVIQGYYLARPMPLKEFSAWVQQERETKTCAS